VKFKNKKILNEFEIQALGEQLYGLVDQANRRKLLLDFSTVEFLSSAALGKFVGLDKKLKAVGGKLVLCNIAPQIAEIFDLTRMRRVFKIFDDEQEGLQAF
jgi:anti-sigma B factor antagonist